MALDGYIKPGTLVQDIDGQGVVIKYKRPNYYSSTPHWERSFAGFLISFGKNSYLKRTMTLGQFYTSWPCSQYNHEPSEKGETK